MTFKPMDEITISTYHEYVLEGISAIRDALEFLDESEESYDDEFRASHGGDPFQFLAETMSRHAILMIANSLEAAANGLLLSLQLPNTFYQDLEKLNTINKFEVFCSILGKNFDRGTMHYQRVKDVVTCRNEFVHPKPQWVKHSIDPASGSSILDTKKTSSRGYPLYFLELKLEHSLNALTDVLAFLSWVCYDVCGFEINEGAMRLGFHSFGSNADIGWIERKVGRKFDQRTFGNAGSMHSSKTEQA